MKNILKFRLNRHLLSAAMGVGMLGVLIVGNMGTAMADDSHGAMATLNVTSGSLTDSASIGTLTKDGGPLTAPFAMDGANHTIVIDLPITATDWTGTGSGWKVSIAAGKFTTTDTLVHTLQDAPTVNRLSTATATTGSGTNGADPANILSATSSTLLSTSPNYVFKAAATIDDSDHTGMGQYSLDTTVTQKIYADDYIPAADQHYETTFTVAIVTGP